MVTLDFSVLQMVLQEHFLHNPVLSNMVFIAGAGETISEYPRFSFSKNNHVFP